MCVRALLAGLLMAGAAFGDTAALTFAAPGSADLFLTAPPNALVRERRELPLSRGLNRLIFTWDRTNLDRNTVRLRLLAQPDQARVLARVLPPDRQDRVLFEVESAADGAASFLVTYALRNVAWRPEYVATLSPDSQRLDLDAVAVVSNDSGQPLRNVRLVLGSDEGRGGGELPLPAGVVEIGQSVRVPYRHWAGLPMRQEYVVDDARYANRAAIRLILENAPGAGLGTEPLIAGKLRVFQARPAAMPTLLAEDQLPATPLGEKSEILLGFVDELTLERKVVRSARFNERKDGKGAVVVYDLDEEIELKIESRFDRPVETTIVEHPDGYWVLRDTKLPVLRRDANTLELRVQIEPQAVTRARWRIEHRNLAP